ncbi:GntR family transcriptional regulator [Streptomyces rhizosphaerihabitans]|uniref:GntR family transcriptional regulator n=1 Tax=Streptomyces rhizosphaerihabitans TaxID=1266770 RepID=UPI0021BE643D|nr:winged helix-turn-helix domain-containing protein [Streptomyces rhizosphaerihabitans]MCT9003628.1 winged helix-turn-helix domain-containing protein [Streptomyces rhizosphaerihabitans]
MVNSRGAGDEDSGRRAFLRVENALHNLLTNGTYRPGDILPTQRELAAEYGVSRDTVQKVLARMREDGFISSRQGSGSTVLRVPGGAASIPRQDQRGRVTLDTAIRRAFEEPQVSLDAYNLTSETLGGHIRVQVERIVAGEIAPREVRMRILLPSTDKPLAYPRAVDPADVRVWERFRGIAQQREEALRDMVVQLRSKVEELKLSVDVRLDIRRTAATPQFKLYVFNDSEMLHGFYELVPKSIDVGDGVMVPALDVLGLGLSLHHYRREEGESRDSSFFASAKGWFDSNWDMLGDDE